MGQENNFEIPALMPIEQGEIKSRKIQSNVPLNNRWIQKGSNFKIFFPVWHPTTRIQPWEK